MSHLGCDVRHMAPDPRCSNFNTSARAAEFLALVGGAAGTLLLYSANRNHDSGVKFAQLAIRCQSRRTSMSLLILVVDDEPDVEALFRQQFRRDLRACRLLWSLPNPLQPHFDESPMRYGCRSF